MIVSASFNFEPWLKLWATSSFLLAPAYLNVNPEKMAVGSILITAPAAGYFSHSITAKDRKKSGWGERRVYAGRLDI